MLTLRKYLFASLPDGSSLCSQTRPSATMTKYVSRVSDITKLRASMPGVFRKSTNSSPNVITPTIEMARMI